jgi:hypothetical protein
MSLTSAGPVAGRRSTRWANEALEGAEADVAASRGVMDGSRPGRTREAARERAGGLWRGAGSYGATVVSSATPGAGCAE